jgi:DNA-binding response OmpR family regulator
MRQKDEPPCRRRRHPAFCLVADGGTELSSRRPAIGEAGFDVDTAQKASGAIGLLTARRYAAILTDCDLPDLPALDWLAAIRGVASTIPLSFTPRRRRATLTSCAAAPATSAPPP